MELDRPILITGTPRSGKTCVWNILRQMNEFYAIEEPIMIWTAGGKRWPDDRRPAAAATEKTKKRIVGRCEKLLQRSGKQRYLDNLSHHALRLPFIHAVMPNARLIHVIRDPVDAVPEIAWGWTRSISISAVIKARRRNVDVRALPRLACNFGRNYLLRLVRGCRSTWGPVVPGLADFCRNHSPAEVAAYQWAKMVDVTLDDTGELPDRSVMELRYEDLVADPRREARRIAAFAEVTAADALIEFATRYINSQDPSWRQRRWEPSEQQWKAIRHIVAGAQSRLQYDPAA